MWQPEPAWQRLPGGLGSSSGVWRTPGGSIVKRLVPPSPADLPALGDPRSPAYWRREADVALGGLLAHTPGLRAAPVLRVAEDDEGVVVVHREVPADGPNGLFVAASLGRFAGAALSAPWLARDQLRFRLERTAARGGWTSLAHSPAADLAARLWTRREHWLSAVASLPQVAQHGDPVPANMRAVADGHVVAVDWATLGLGPVGADLGYWSLSAREAFEPLLRAYADALPAGTATVAEVELGARVTAAYTVLGRADWALSRVLAGALASAFRDPQVAPYLRAINRALDRIEPLTG